MICKAPNILNPDVTAAELCVIRVQDVGDLQGVGLCHVLGSYNLVIILEKYEMASGLGLVLVWVAVAPTF